MLKVLYIKSVIYYKDGGEHIMKNMKLFEPIEINHLQLKNRVVMPAMNLGYTHDGTVNERLIEFYRQRALGGAGLIMVGGTAVEKTGVIGGFVSLHADDFIKGHQQLCDTLHEEGAAAGCQLFQAGRYSAAFSADMDVYAPSPIPSRLTRHTPQELSNKQVYQMIDHFGQAALRAKKAHYDLVEVIMSAGYLVSEFLSPLTNQRTDEFGGCLEKRMRFAVEIIRTIRQQVGPDYPISVRLGASDFIPGGTTLEDTSLLARELEKAGADMINVTGGWHESPVPQISAAVPRASYVYLASRIKENVTIPVAASNRINSPALAEQILLSGQADLISIARGMLADPDWVCKAAGKNPHPIRKCIACMNCLHSLFKQDNNGVYCAINPEAGQEYKGKITPARKAKKILIIGAGPAGLEAARAAALFGHEVELWERENSIGGQWKIACIPPGKEEFRSLIEYYEEELPCLGVRIKTDCNATAEKIAAYKADAVLIATGARPLTPSIPRDDQARVIDAWDVLKGHPVPGPRVLIIGGGSVGCETALYLAEKGTLSAAALKFLFMHGAETPDTLYQLVTESSYKVSIIEKEARLAQDMIDPVRWGVIKHLHMLNIETVLNHSVCEIGPRSVTVVDKDKHYQTIAADTIIMAVGVQPDQTLYQALKNSGENVFLLGDARTPGQVKDAIHDSFTLIQSL